MASFIALSEAPRQGKSRTINILYHQMLLNGFEIVRDRKIAGSGDFFAIFIKNGVRIGVTSYGDNVNRILHHFDIFRASNCDIMVCASRLVGPIRDAINDYSERAADFMPKTTRVVEAEQLIANENDTRELLNRIEALI